MINSHNQDRFNKLQVALSTSSHFITDIYQSFIIGLIPLLKLKFGLSLFEVGLLTATSVIANSLFSPVFGFFSDRHGLKYFLILGPLVTSIFLSLLGIIPNYYFLLICLFIGNLGVAAYHPASAAIAGHFGGNKKGISSSIINFGGNFGSALGVLLIIFIAEKINMMFTPIAMIPGIIMVIILLKYIPSSMHGGNPLKFRGFFAKIKKVNKSKLYLLFLVLFSVYTLYIMWLTIFTYIPLYYTGKGATLVTAGVIMFLFGMLGGAGGMLSGWLFDKFKKGSYIIQAGFLCALPLFYFAFRTPMFISFALFILGGVFLISAQPVCIRITQDLLPGNVSFASSLILGFSPGLAAITIIFLGKVADRIGIAQLIKWELLLVAFTIILLFSYPLAERKNQIVKEI